VFSSDRIHKVIKDVNIYFFIHSSNSCKLYQRIPVNYPSEFQEFFEATTYIFVSFVLTVLRAEKQEITAQVLLKFLESNWILLVVIISFSCNTW